MYMCPHTTILVFSCYFMCPHTTTYVYTYVVGWGIYICISTQGRRRLRDFTAVDEFYLTTAEKKFLENCRCSVPNFMNDLLHLNNTHCELYCHYSLVPDSQNFWNVLKLWGLRRPWVDIYTYYVCMCVCVCVYVCMYVCIYIHTYTHTYISLLINCCCTHSSRLVEFGSRTRLKTEHCARQTQSSNLICFAFAVRSFDGLGRTRSKRLILHWPSSCTLSTSSSMSFTADFFFSIGLSRCHYRDCPPDSRYQWALSEPRLKKQSLQSSITTRSWGSSFSLTHWPQLGLEESLKVYFLLH
jgi:hypothetical protein